MLIYNVAGVLCNRSAQHACEEKRYEKAGYSVSPDCKEHKKTKMWVHAQLQPFTVLWNMWSWSIRDSCVCNGTLSILLGVKEFIFCFSISISSRATIHKDTRSCSHVRSGWCWSAWSRRRRIGTRPPSTRAKCRTCDRPVCRGNAHSLSYTVWRGESYACNLIRGCLTCSLLTFIL